LEVVITDPSVVLTVVSLSVHWWSSTCSARICMLNGS